MSAKATDRSRHVDVTNTPDAAALSVHRFRPALLDTGPFANDLTEHVQERLALPGLIGARVLLEYGGSRVVLVAEWESISTEILGSAALYRDARLSAILRRSTTSDSAVYTAVEASTTETESTRSNGRRGTTPR